MSDVEQDPDSIEENPEPEADTAAESDFTEGAESSGNQEIVREIEFNTEADLCAIADGNDESSSYKNLESTDSPTINTSSAASYGPESCEADLNIRGHFTNQSDVNPLHRDIDCNDRDIGCYDVHNYGRVETDLTEDDDTRDGENEQGERCDENLAAEDEQYLVQESVHSSQHSGTYENCETKHNPSGNEDEFRAISGTGNSGNFLPESDVVESLQRDLECAVGGKEDEPTESDQENECQAGMAYQRNTNIEAVSPNPCLNNRAGGTESDGHVYNRISAVPEDEISVVSSGQALAEVDLYQPECDQSDTDTGSLQSSPHRTAVRDQSSPHRTAVADQSSPRRTVVHGNQSGVIQTHGPNPTLDYKNTRTFNPELCMGEQQSELRMASVSALAESANSNCDNSTMDVKSGLECNESDLKTVHPSVCPGAIPKHRSSPESIRNPNTYINKANTLSSDKLSNNESEDDLLSELDATLKDSFEPSVNHSNENHLVNKDILGNNSPSLDQDADSCEQCRRNNLQCSLSTDGAKGPGKVSGLKDVKVQLSQAKQLLYDRECEISR